MFRRWLLPVGAVAVALVGMVAVSVLAVSPAESAMAVQTRNLAEVSGHHIPQGVKPEATTHKAPTVVWVVRDGDTWRALSNQTAHPLACDITWDVAQAKFSDPCLGTSFDRQGRYLGGPAPQGLDSYPVTVKPHGWIEIDLRHPEPAK